MEVTSLGEFNQVDQPQICIIDKKYTDTVHIVQNIFNLIFLDSLEQNIENSSEEITKEPLFIGLKSYATLIEKFSVISLQKQIQNTLEDKTNLSWLESLLLSEEKLSDKLQLSDRSIEIIQQFREKNKQILNNNLIYAGISIANIIIEEESSKILDSYNNLSQTNIKKIEQMKKCLQNKYSEKKKQLLINCSLIFLISILAYVVFAVSRIDPSTKQDFN